MSPPINFVIRPEHILIGFLKAFFSQPQLFDSLDNSFLYTDGVSENTLSIQMTGDFDHETVESIPALVLQEGGFQEERRAIDQMRTWDWEGSDSHKTEYRHNFTLHCLTRFRGTSKLLQGACSKAIRNFRKALYQMGIDEITPVSGMPPQKLDSSPTMSVPSYHAASIQFSVLMANDWILSPDGDPVDEVFVRMLGVLENTEFDTNGDPLLPADMWVSQNLHVENMP